jgi:transposase
MAYRYGNRNQMALLPPSIEEYVPNDAPVRAYDAMISAMDFSKLGIEIDSNRVGNTAYDPKAMLKLLVYGYSYGVRSSRKIEREANYNLSFLWLTGGLKPDHKTIAEFRRKNKSGLREVLKQCARICIDLDLIVGNTLFVDGTKIKADASSANNWTEKRCEAKLKEIEKRIEEILAECDAVDEAEEAEPSYVKMREELKEKEVLKAKVESVLKELEASGKKKINTTDRDSRVVKSAGGFCTGYNAQAVVDEKNGLIVSADVVDSATDANQLTEQIENANEVLEKKCEVACADAGYYSTEDLKDLDDSGIKVVVPNKEQASGKEAKEFSKKNFQYDKERDIYICPEGKELVYAGDEPERKRREYRIEGKGVCLSCKNFGKCTRSRRGRTIKRLHNEELMEKFARQYKENGETYKKRKIKAEMPFGHIKRNLGARGFLLRGYEGVKAELSLLGSCFNIRRVMTILGVRGLMNAIGAGKAY